MLEHKLKPALKSKRRECFAKGVIFQYDIATPHSDQLIRGDKLQDLSWEVVLHPTYSLDLPCLNQLKIPTWKKICQQQRSQGSDAKVSSRPIERFLSQRN